MRVLGVYWGWESHPPPPSPCVQEDLTLPPPLPTPPPLAARSEPVRASGSLRPCELFLGLGLRPRRICESSDACELASLRSIYLRPSSIRGSACDLDRGGWVLSPRLMHAAAQAGGCELSLTPHISGRPRWWLVILRQNSRPGRHRLVRHRR